MIEYPTKTMAVGGVTLIVRCNSSDDAVVTGIIAGDEYLLTERNFSGWAIDLGAHIGSASVLLLSRNPDLRVIAVEPLPGNVDILAQNLAPYGERAVIVAAAAGDGDSIEIGYDFGGIDLPEDYRISNHFIGRHLPDGKSDRETVTVPTVTLVGLMAEHGIDEIALVKTDCEGGEYQFFADPAANARVRVIVGEWHDDSGQRIRELLAGTHDFVRFAPVRPSGDVTGLFEAIRR